MRTNLNFQFLNNLNFFINIYILFVLLFFGQFELASEGFVLVSLLNIFTHGFSSNIRNIYLGSGDNFSLKKIIFFRIIIGIFGLFISLTISFIYINDTNFYFHISLSILTIINWITQLTIAYSEKKNLFNYYHLASLILILSLSPFLIQMDLINHLCTLIILTSLFNISIYKNSVKFDKNLNFNSFKPFIDIGLFSTILKTFSNFAWRYFLFLLIGKNHSSIMFMAFSLGSFFGTVFDISYGAYFLKKIRNKKLFINLLYFSYALLILLFLIFYKQYAYIDEGQYLLLKLTTFFSVIGAFFLVHTLHLRQKLFEIKDNKTNCYKFDIISYSFNFILIPLIFIINDKYLVSAYFLSSLFFFLIYKFLFLIVKNK